MRIINFIIEYHIRKNITPDNQVVPRNQSIKASFLCEVDQD